MRLLILFCVFFYSSFIGYGQDTLYAYPYPNGIIVDKAIMKKYENHFRFTPINNSEIEIRISRREILKVNYFSGDNYVNELYVPDRYDYQVFPVDSKTGNIIYSDIIRIEGANKQDLFNSLDYLPNSQIKYNLVSADNKNYSFKKYIGTFIAYFAGDCYTVFFNLEIRFKDGRVKYKYSDFIGEFSRDKYRSAELIEGLEMGNKASKKTVKILSQSYARGERKSDNKKFWIPINKNINQSIRTIERILSEANGENDDW